ncbi:MAG: MMPL family transporter [Stagnimonas sp.]|nr:MMPL family transporter [Stagnimonas sp.]
MSDRLQGLLHLWVLFIQRWARAVAWVCAGLAALAVVVAALRLSVDTNPANMLDSNLPWRQAELALDRAFPNSDGGLVLVIEAAEPSRAAAAQAALAAILKPQLALFADVRAAELEPYFQQNGLLYLEPDVLQDVADGVLRAQPFLGTLAREPSLAGLAGLIEKALLVPDAGSSDFDLVPALNAVAEATEAAATGKVKPLDWARLMATPASLSPSPRKFIELVPTLDYGRLQPAKVAIAAIRSAIAEVQSAKPGYADVRIRLTGRIALEHEEIGMAFSGALLAFGVALVLSAGLLFVALRSRRLVLATVLTLLFGLVLTAAFAGLVVQKLNLISMAFAVLYVGLGLDYALYLALRYRELRQHGTPHREAVPQAASDIGGFLFVCAATTSLGFLAFVPTAFTGIAGLGLISGAGMFISLIASLTLLPALLTLLPPPAPGPSLPGRWLEALLELPYRKRREIWIGMAVLLLLAAYFAPRARFDFDPLHLRDPDSESVRTFRDLLADPLIPTLTLSAIVADAAEAEALAAKVRPLATVRQVMTLAQLVPMQQAEKLAIIEDLAFSLGPELTTPGELEVVARAEDAAAIDRLEVAMQQAARQWRGPPAAAAARLAKALEALQSTPRPLEAVALLRSNLLDTLGGQIAQLRLSLTAHAVTAEDLPLWLRARWLAEDGRQRVEIWPRAVLDDNDSTRTFVRSVQAVVPAVSGPPVGMIEAGEVVVQSFQQAFLYSAGAIGLLLLILLRSLRDTLLVLLPLAAAGLLTMAASVVTNTPFNFANVIALPLLLGVGVDYGVYLVQQARRLPADANLLKTGATRAVLFGALVTMANFGDLMLARHPGMVSMGLLLTVGLGVILLCTLVLLPGLLQRFRR